MEYNTGILKTKVGEFGVTESEYSLIFFHLITGIFGQSVWSTTVGSLLPSIVTQLIPVLDDIQLGRMMAYGYTGLIFSLCVYSYLSTIWR